MNGAFLLKYSEIALKGKNRIIFENALVKQIKFTLRFINGNFKVFKEQGRILVTGTDFNYTEALNTLLHIFGITGICPTKILESTNIEDIKKEVISFVNEHHNTKQTFKVKARRADKKYPLTSPEISALLGSVILENNSLLNVDLHNPDFLLNVEIRNNTYIYSKEIKGIGGMPIGTSGNAMLLLSGGIDSPVAGYMIAKRGVRIDAVYFHAPPYTSERAKDKVISLAKKISKYTGPINLHIVNFTEPQLFIYKNCPHDELTIIMRRSMMKIAEHFALKNKALGLITGESIGQVASQTMHSLFATNSVCTLPVYRPLIAFDKQEIINIAQKIDTYETSILPYEDCCTIFVAKHPVTKPRLEKIEKSEKNLTEEYDKLIEIAINTTEILHID